MARSPIGVWLIGAKGGVATTALVGLIALRKGLIPEFGLVSRLSEFQGLDLVVWDQIVMGGHDIRAASLFDEAMRMHTESRAISAELLNQCRGELEAIERHLRPGTVFNVGPTIERLASDEVRSGRATSSDATPKDIVARIQGDLRAFATEHGLEHVIVVNVASTEPPADVDKLPGRWADLEPMLAKPTGCPLTASSLYAIAALDLGHSYINFTPSAGATPPAIQELALLRNTRHAGCDGKTGETLLKTTLAPMFAARNLNVMSWVGHNIFGNMDGKVLDDPRNKAAKVTSKDQVLAKILGYSPQTLVTIEYIASMGDWKTAWDHIHFQGFLGTPMTMQFTWQGCDSLLAAPLLLDLVRFTERAWRNGETGVLSHLSSFFKSPIGIDQHDFERQFQMLQAWAASIT